MTKRCKQSAALTPDERQSRAIAARDILKQVRALREQAQFLDLELIAYLLQMAEVEAADIAANLAMDGELMDDELDALGASVSLPPLSSTLLSRTLRKTN